MTKNRSKCWLGLIRAGLRDYVKVYNWDDEKAITNLIGFIHILSSVPYQILATTSFPDFCHEAAHYEINSRGCPRKETSWQTSVSAWSSFQALHCFRP